MDTKQQFLTEFKALLEKYDVALLSSDRNLEAYERKTGQTLLLVQGNEMNFRDIETE
jgi:hypothetical protein